MVHAGTSGVTEVGPDHSLGRYQGHNGMNATNGRRLTGRIEQLSQMVRMLGHKAALVEA